MSPGEGGKPRIVVGRPLRAAALAFAVVLVHLALLQDAQPPAPRRFAPVMSLRAVEPRAAPALRPPVAPAGSEPPKSVANVVSPQAAPKLGPQPVAPDAPAVAQAMAATAPAQPASSAAASDEADDLPVYPTRLPPPLDWRYRFVRNGAVGRAELHWRPQGDRYEARFTGDAGGAPVFEWTSAGGLDGAGVAPERYLDRRGGRGAQAANFRRDSARITYSGPPVQQPLPPGTQDRLSWLPQLAAIVAATPGRWREGDSIRVFVSGARGDAGVWSFRWMGLEMLPLQGAELPTWKLVRQPVAPYDLRVEVWLDPARHHMPVQVAFTNGAVSWALSLEEEGAPAGETGK